MPQISTVATSLPPRLPPSSIVDPIQRSPVLSPKVSDPRQQRSGSAFPSSPPHRPATPPRQPPGEKTEDGSQNSERRGSLIPSPRVAPPIDMETFRQILELDEDGESYDFAWEMAEAYFDQAETTFEEIETAIVKKDCGKLSELGHFLKGSSATLGVTKVQNSCESIQHHGALRDNKTGKVITPEVALSKISVSLKEAKEQYKEAETWLRKWYSVAEAQAQAKKDKDD